MQVIREMDVSDTICEVLKFLTTVKNKVSIAAQNNKSPDNPANYGNNLLNLFKFCSFISIHNSFYF